ncbi:MAG: hypothetical protein ABI895_08230 [Deltaproteobacteria bacterium]
MLAVAGPVDIDANGVHREAIDDRSGERGVAEVAAQTLSLMLELTTVEARL